MSTRRQENKIPAVEEAGEGGGGGGRGGLAEIRKSSGI